ncbi:hypothetical protein FRC11_013734 [Ceratobasidium sp. 423]|nr:hypothetical protein FRC11_013734 [Ceratobasidium sp. 423]
MSTPPGTNPPGPDPGNSGVPVRDGLDDYVNSAEFDITCSQKKHELARALSSDDGDFSDDDSLWTSSESVSTTATDESPIREISKLEAYFYYYGVNLKGRWPRLLMRDSTDEFLEPTGPHAHVRRMRLAYVPEDHDFAKNGLWETVRDWVAVFLIQNGVNVSSVDFLMGEIRAFLDSLEVKNVDIAFRESIAQSLVASGPELYAPVESGDPLQDFIDNVSVALSLPISGRKTTMQGTMGPYFQKDGKLYAITARHNLFLANDGNPPYKYNASGPKREVVVMGNPAFTNYQASIQARIGTLNDTVKALVVKIDSLRGRVANGIGLPAMQERLEENEAELIKIRRQIVSLKQFFVTLARKWSKLTDRVIGHVVWSPPIGVGVGPERYTRDVCVIELDKSKFRHLIGNVLGLGPEYSPSDLTSLLYERIDVPSEFKYPPDGLLHLRGMLKAEQVNNPNSLNLQGDLIRRVLKRGFTTNTTIGTLGKFQSFVRKYFLSGGTLESIELPILSHENETGTFSKGGDSGALIVSPKGEFIGLLSGGTNKGTDGSDITYATLFDWVWDLVLEEFPGANLYWDDIVAFLAA